MKSVANFHDKFYRILLKIWRLYIITKETRPVLYLFLRKIMQHLRYELIEQWKLNTIFWGLRPCQVDCCQRIAAITLSSNYCLRAEVIWFGQIIGRKNLIERLLKKERFTGLLIWRYSSLMLVMGKVQFNCNVRYCNW